MTYDSETVSALASGALVLRDLITITGQDGDGDPAAFGFWIGDGNISIDVISGVDGGSETRDFVGDGALLDVPPIADAIGLDAPSLTFGFSQIETNVQDMVRANNIRVARVEVHRAVYAPDTWQPVSDAFPRFVGRVDGVRVDTAASGEEGSTSIDVISDANDLTRTNPALKSDETQKLRDGDRFRRYSDTAGNVEVWWGQTRGSA